MVRVHVVVGPRRRPVAFLEEVIAVALVAHFIFPEFFDESKSMFLFLSS